MAVLPASNIIAMNSLEGGRSMMCDVTTYISVMQLPWLLIERSLSEMTCESFLLLWFGPQSQCIWAKKYTLSLLHLFIKGANKCIIEATFICTKTHTQWMPFIIAYWSVHSTFVSWPCTFLFHCEHFISSDDVCVAVFVYFWYFHYGISAGRLLFCWGLCLDVLMCCTRWRWPIMPKCLFCCKLMCLSYSM